jgi:superfamily II DNA or RNA helicase
MTTISMRGYEVLKTSLESGDIDALRRDLTVKPHVSVEISGENVKEFPVFHETDEAIIVPKYFGLRNFGEPDTVALASPPPASIDVPFAGSLRPEQQRAVDAFLEAARDPLRMGGILSLPCGGGKTVCALSIVAALGVKTMVVVHKDFLLNQWKERIEAFLPSARVGVFRGKKRETEDRDIIIGTLQTLSMQEFDPHRLFGDVGLICVDECHRTGAEVFCRVYQRLTTKYALGLSATLVRKDGLSKVFRWHIGETVFKGESGGRGEVHARMCTFPGGNAKDGYGREFKLYNGTTLNISKMINAVCACPERNAYICDLVREAFGKEPGRKALVLSDRRQHLHDLRDILSAAGVSCGFYYGGLSQDALRASEACAVLLATYAFCAEGLDVAALDTLVLASPKSDVVQATGRILRQKPESRAHVPVILDVVDDYSLFARQAAKRKRYYGTQGYEIKT